MRIGFIGSGNMARAIALGLKEPAVFSDSGSGRAASIAELVGGSVDDNAGVSSQSDVLFLCHKPAQLAAVAEEIGSYKGTVVSVLAATTLDSLRSNYPDAQVMRSMPNVPVEFSSGVFAIAAEGDNQAEVLSLLDRLGSVVEIPEAEFEIATAIGGCAPAFFALFSAELIRAAVVRGMSEELAKKIVGQTLSGTGDVLAANGVDTGSTMRAVASPGGLTEKALASFDESKLRDAVDRAVATVLGE